jgi:hypothetical protein
MTKLELGKYAMLVSVNIINGGLLGERKDAQASELVQTTYNVSHRRAKASKYLLDRTDKRIRRVIAGSQRVREVIYKYTLPWGDEKMRLVTTGVINEFRAKLKQALREVDEIREEYLNIYPDLVAQSEFDLGPLFDSSQYPTVDQARNLFKTNVNWWPFPETGHFVAEVSHAAASEAKHSMEREIEERLIEATHDMVRRAQEVVAAFIEKLEATEATFTGAYSDETETWKSNGVIRDSLIDNISETADLISRMNLTGNPKIEKAVKDLNRLCNYSAEHWRKFPKTFQDDKPKALTTAQEILAGLQMIDMRDAEIHDMVSGGEEYMD